MAIGARKAFQELPNEADQERWLKLPFTGCDGLPKTGQAWVRSGILAASVFVPPNTGQAMEMLSQAIQQGKKLPESALTVPVSIPPLAELKPR
jgi:ribose transport system substrate-binding protein